VSAASPAGQRVSIRKLRPSIQPNCCRRPIPDLAYRRFNMLSRQGHRAGTSIDLLVLFCSAIDGVASSLLVVADLIKVCLDIYNQWPQRRAKRQ
jgi:hypothetical protein